MPILFGIHIKNVILLILRRFKKEPLKLTISLKNCSHKERLQILNLPTLKYRRLRGDMIDVFKIANNMYVLDALFHWQPVAVAFWFML